MDDRTPLYYITIWRLWNAERVGEHFRMRGERAAMHTKQCRLDVEDDGTIVKPEIGVTRRIRDRRVQGAAAQASGVAIDLFVSPFRRSC